MKLKTLTTTITLLFFLSTLSAQPAAEEPGDLMAQERKSDARATLTRITDKIVIDGDLTEASWFAGKPATGFWEYFPSDTSLNPVQTEIYMAYDDNNLYIGAICHSVGEDYVVNSLRRDYNAGGNDNLTFLLDPFQDKTNAFVFGMNPYGVMREALIANGGQNWGDWDSAWDNKWKGESKIHDGYWSTEVAIPFSTLRFNPGTTRWNFNAYRFDTQSNTRSTLVQIPQNQTIMSLAYMDPIEWEESPRPPKKNISIIPFVTAGTNRNFAEGTDPNNNFAVGADAKIAVTSGLNLDLTVNPDFSQVEVDRQVINLDRFEIFFPERRQFFLENADLFGSFGESRVNPFFSRRIGIDQDTAGNRVQVPILYGARLSGKLDNNWRVGMLNMHTMRDPEAGLPAVNYSVAAVQRKIAQRSNIGLIFVNKQAFPGNDNSETMQDVDAFNRVIGLDYNLNTPDNKWTGKTYYHQAITTNDELSAAEKFAHGARLEYRVRDVSVEWSHRWVREGFQPELGFVPRRNVFRVNPSAQLFFYPEKGPINRWQVGTQYSAFWKPQYGKTDQRISLFGEFNFKNTSELRFSASNDYTYLFDSFDPSRSDGTPLPADSEYNYTSYGVSYRSDRRKVFSYRINPEFGQFFNGNRYSLRGSLTYRYQPLGQIAMNINYTYLDMPAPYTSTGLFLIGPRIDLTFSKSLFLTTFIQYNSQAENMNINTRFQWRFAPVSDFFLVYTDNYDTMNFDVKNRAIVAKVTYWLNL